MKIITIIFSDLVYYLKNMYSYLYWNSKGVRITLSCKVSTKATIGKDCVFTGTTLITDKAIIDSNTNGHNLKIHSAIVGNFCSFGPDVKIGLYEHPLNERSTHPSFYGKVIQKKVIINDHGWLRANAVILYGVEIQKHSIIGAGAVVTANVDPFSVYGGVPAKKIKSISSENKV